MKNRIDPKEISAFARERKASIHEEQERELARVALEAKLKKELESEIERARKSRANEVQKIWSQQKRKCLKAALNGARSIQLSPLLSKGDELCRLGFGVHYAYVADAQLQRARWLQHIKNKNDEASSSIQKELSDANQMVTEFIADVEFFFEAESKDVAEYERAKKTFQSCISKYFLLLEDEPKSRADAGYLYFLVGDLPSLDNLPIQNVRRKLTRLQQALVEKYDAQKRLDEFMSQSIVTTDSNEVEIERLFEANLDDLMEAGDPRDYFIVDWEMDDGLDNFSSDDEFTGSTLGWLSSTAGQSFLEGIERKVRNSADHGLLETTMVFRLKLARKTGNVFSISLDGQEFDNLPSLELLRKIFIFLGYSCSVGDLDDKAEQHVELGWH